MEEGAPPWFELCRQFKYGNKESLLSKGYCMFHDPRINRIRAWHCRTQSAELAIFVCLMFMYSIVFQD